MKQHRLIYIILAVAALATASCKKDSTDSTETKPSLYGLDFRLPPYGRTGDSFTLTPSGVYASSGTPETISYSWQLNGGGKDTLDVFSYTATSIRRDTISCTAFADGYYSTALSQVISIIDPTLGKTLTGTGIRSVDDHITDTREGPANENTYYYTEATGLKWFRNNLAYTGSGLAYEGAEVTSYVLGRYYTWEEAQTACPDGWRLPTATEWAALGTTAGDWMADASLDGETMWEYWPEVKITDAYRLAVIPAGYALTGSSTPTFNGLNTYAAFWSSTQEGDRAAYVYLHVKEPKVMTTYGDKQTFAASVRCVQ